MIDLVYHNDLDMDYELEKLFLKISENMWSVLFCPVL